MIILNLCTKLNTTLAKPQNLYKIEVRRYVNAFKLYFA
jgi:hypothetical protein